MHVPAALSRLAVAYRHARSGRRLPDPVTATVVAATAVFALAGIGSPLLGLSVFADTGSLAAYSGYRDVLAGVQPQTIDLRDQVDAAMPNSILFGRALRSGEFAAWNPYAVGGDTLGSTPNLALGSPLSLPYWLMPGWLAPAYVHLLELICAIGGTYLFLRRLRLGRASAALGGLAYASSAFMIVWTGWPQTRVAALIPALFWAVERLAQRVRVREVALVALAVAGLLLGGFPTVTGYALLTATAYLLTRVLAEHRLAGRPVMARLGAAAVGVAAGIGLCAWQLVPWARYMPSVLVMGRAQTPDSHIPGEALLTSIAPYAFGSISPARPPDWFGGLRLIDADAYVGSAVLVLAVAAVALAGPARARLPRGVWWLLVGTTVGWTVVLFFGGPLLGALQRLPYLFSDNFVGRARSVFGFLVAVLAAVGFEVVRSGARASRSRWRRAYGIGVWSALAAGGVVAYLAGRAVARWGNPTREPGEPDLPAYLDRQLVVGLVLVAVAAAAVAWLWWARRGAAWSRPAAAVVVVLLVAGQALWFARTFHPRTDRAHFYPTTPTQAFLAAHLGHQRYYGADGAIFGSVDVMARLRAYHGHAFIQRTYADLAETMPGQQFVVPPTAIISDAFGGSAALNPALDRAAVSYYVAPPWLRPFGPIAMGRSDGTRMTLLPGQTVSVPVPLSGPVRGVGLRPVSAMADGNPDPPALSVVLSDATGLPVAHGQLRPAPKVPGTPRRAKIEDPLWTVPVAGESVPAGARLTADITVLGAKPVTVAAMDGRPALSVVAAADDGLRLVYAEESVIYQRTGALDRARWASATVVEPDPEQRVRLVSGGALRPDQVVLDAPGPAADGAPAEVTWVGDGLNEMVLSVRAQGAGYVVLADALRIGWRVTVDGVPARSVAADHAFVAVAVGRGQHTVRWYYPLPWTGPGAWITVVTALALLVGLGIEAVRRRVRP